MRRMMLLIGMGALLSVSLPTPVMAQEQDESVRTYKRRDGTVVEGHTAIRCAKGDSACRSKRAAIDKAKKRDESRAERAKKPHVAKARAPRSSSRASHSSGRSSSGRSRR